MRERGGGYPTPDESRSIMSGEGFGKVSRLVTSHVGVKQGCPLSPKLLSLFVNDLDIFMKSNGARYVSLDWFRLSCTLFADDIALVADSRDNLKKQQDIIKKYLEKKDIELNAKKSVVLVFRSKGAFDSEVLFNCRGMMLEVKEKFIYLGV